MSNPETSKSFVFRTSTEDPSGVDVLALRHQSNLPPEQHVWDGLTFHAEQYEKLGGSFETAVQHHVGRCGLELVDVSFVERADHGPVFGIEVAGDLDIHQASELFSAGFWVSPDTARDLQPQESRSALELFQKHLEEKRGLLKSSERLFSAEDWSLCVIKPDAKELGIESEIRGLIDSDELSIESEIDHIQLDRTHLGQLWPAPPGQKAGVANPWWAATLTYMQQAPVDILLVHGDNASNKMKDIKRQLRDKYYRPGYQDDKTLPESDRVKSIIHSSDRNEELFTNALGFWSSHDLNATIARTIQTRKTK